jgi:hypothetical protein
MKCAWLGILLLSGASVFEEPATPTVGGSSGSAALAQTPTQPLSANDVSWLFPAPKQAGDFAKLIAVHDLTTPNPQDPTKRDQILSDVAFQQFIAIAASPATAVAGTTNRIGLPSQAQSIDAWFVAGVRIDAGAPGLSDAVIAQYGQSPQIRLIIQPVIRNADGTPKLLDTAGHLIFGFTAGADAPAEAGCFPRPKPDLAALKAIVAELAELRTKLGQGQLGTNKIVTAGVPLGVHPGLLDATTAQGVRQEMKAFLERHLSSQRLGSMAIMALPANAPEPWIFLAMQGVPAGIVPQLPNGGFVPVHGPTLDGQQFAQMLDRVGAPKRVVPTPHPNNLNPITCQHAALQVAAPPLEARKGSSTADVFANSNISDPRAILDLVADPERSHFFNTDCISCHTETRLGMDRLHIANFAGVDPSVLPNGQWNVRNFGWSPPIEGPVQGTVTRRTAAETAAVVNFINAQLLAQ